MVHAPITTPIHGQTSLDTKTVLILFVQIVFILIYLVSLALVVMRRAKKLITSPNRKYYVAIVFYIASKLILCVILVVKVILGMANQWSDIDPDQVELILKTSLVLTNFSVIQLFLIALETYLTHCFSVVSNASSKRREKLMLLGLKIMQILVIMILLIPLIVYDVDELGYTIINAMDIGLTLIIILLFLGVFFYLNFRMTGIMMESRINEIIKRIYKVQLIILVSRAVSITFDIIIALYVLPNSFQQEIQTISNDIKYEIVLAMIFVGSVIFLLLTEGLPVMYSLRSGVIDALSHNFEYSDQKQSIFTDHSSDLSESLINTDQSGLEDPPHKEMRMKNFQNITEVAGKKSDSIWICKRGDLQGKNYLIRISKNEISNYIFQDIENEISNWNQLNLKGVSRLAYFCEGEIIHFVQRYYTVTLDQKTDSISSQSEQLELALKLAETIKQMHDKDIVHGSLSPNHIYLHEAQIVINGLGLNSLKKYLSLITGYTNKTLYTAIEHLRDKNSVILKPKKSADIYSFGMILYEMVTKNRQYRQLTLRDVQTKFVQESFRPKLPDHFKIQVKNLIRKCWNQAFDRRPTIEEVISTLRKLV